MLRTVFLKLRSRPPVTSRTFFRNFHAFSKKKDAENSCQKTISDNKCSEDRVIFTNEKLLKYGYIPGILSLAQFYSALSFGSYTLYNAQPSELTELLYISGLSTVLSGVVLFGVRYVTKSIVAEIRVPDSHEYVELTTLGLLGHNLEEINTDDIVDSSAVSTFPGCISIQHTSGKQFLVDIDKGTVLDMPILLRASRGRL